jgi:hypothetical protein
MNIGLLKSRIRSHVPLLCLRYFGVFYTCVLFTSFFLPQYLLSCSALKIAANRSYVYVDFDTYDCKREQLSLPRFIPGLLNDRVRTHHVRRTSTEESNMLRQKPLRPDVQNAQLQYFRLRSMYRTGQYQPQRATWVRGLHQRDIP